MKNTAVSDSATPFYYGWLILAATAVTEMLAQGATSYAAGLFVLPLQSEFHISRAAANMPVLIMFLGAALVAPFVGRALDRYPIRLVISLGAIIFSLAFIGIAVSGSLLVMAAILFLPTAIGFMCTGPLTTSTMASRWFFRHRGLALGIAAVATSGGGFIVVPLLSRAIQHYGWRLGLVYEAIIVGAVMVGLALLILRDRPSDTGLDEHTENLGRDADALLKKQQGPALHWTEILGSRAFWIPSLVVGMVSGTSQALVVTMVPYGVSLGLAATSAAGLISVFAIAAAITKVSAGVLADYINQRFLLIAAATLMALSWLTLGLSVAYWALYTSAGMAGIALGCALPTAAALLAAHFGSARFGAVMGWTYTLIGIISIGASLSIGFIFDRLGGYHSAFLIFFGLLACLLVGTLLVAPARKAL
ncbi:MAG: MFS transporter [Pseudomonadota bacterium]